MKTIQLFLFGIFVAIVMSDCSDRIEETYTVNKPVYMTYDELQNSVLPKTGQDIVQPGKIYFKDQVIFVNEYQQGIHVIDNSDPSNPKVIRFIEIPGNIDMAIRNNILYADNYIDLVALDISNLDNITEVHRIDSIFPYFMPYPHEGIVDVVDNSMGMVVGWEKTDHTEEVTDHRNEYLYYEKYDFHNRAMPMDMAVNTSSGETSTGTGGSMARFTITGNYLYTVDENNLKLFNITVPADPEFTRNVYIDSWGIETIFPYEDKLFIGSQTGMFVYSIVQPDNPLKITKFEHAQRCDPVVVQDDYAYITLRAGNLCGGNRSQLVVVDIGDMYNPKLVKEYVMEEPYGLGIDDSTLFVCDGPAGLKIYNASNPKAIDSNLIKVYPDIHAFDVIPFNDLLLMIGIDGLSQYDYSNTDNIEQLSFIPVYRNINF